MQWYLAVLRNYAGFKGRAGGLEYWIFFLFQLVLLGGLYALGLWTGTLVPYAVYLAATFLPTLALTVRRLHDTGRTGWWALIGVVPIAGTLVVLAFMADEGELTENRFGPQPDRRRPPTFDARRTA
ncbi:DUF805 domain-containing protein [Streptacidiphilus jiangxiensis]|uniref:Uncharacterized membrane protein YhaH, DUF805 family n=1 Tax=Streptacidiphilus jiangxiensis TaxID=235985 RepID=A0A1H7FSQ5_STRJI|nr:DUF805 domain-containing protein [Streptacidiphilus jiangxiensis]SEK27220.1 Uncharacterized membrane protein YhaH, DUF805 family [Streptacidiphilus jiangxiensis]